MFPLLIITLILFLFINVAVFLWAMSVLGSWRAPYVPLPHQVLPGVVKALHIKPQQVVYDIGCGDGRILRACAKQEPHAVYKGVERAWYPSILAHLHAKQKNIFYVCADAFTQSYSDAHRIVLYLLPGFVDSVARKLVSECKEGTRIVAVDFPITFLKPKEVIEQRHLPAHLRGLTLYVYEISHAP